MKTGVQLIAEERHEQIEKHGYTHTYVLDHPHYYEDGQLALAAEMLLASEHEEGIDPESYPTNWDEDICRHILAKDYEGKLIVAGALIAAEIDRLKSKDK